MQRGPTHCCLQVFSCHSCHSRKTSIPGRAGTTFEAHEFVRILGRTWLERMGVFHSSQVALLCQHCWHSVRRFRGSQVSSALTKMYFAQFNVAPIVLARCPFLCASASFTAGRWQIPRDHWVRKSHVPGPRLKIVKVNVCARCSPIVFASMTEHECQQDLGSTQGPQASREQRVLGTSASRPASHLRCSFLFARPSQR